ncbi:MAG: tRNA lysidine(34) synthetase TilS [Syntrophobacterales bacterium CG03_land_8_20_14_0_80_58_14]|nr:MAG: tRNA lysidine(34) synthetase TilS [Syntrophaceae bacterium CG2_30_58_14]PIV06461.1 MAG: tRNA lysidine(34) synthetase TilS [Syntrophobacterales bacterium CG03_land_8_20_14_0_80_58_14]
MLNQVRKTIADHSLLVQGDHLLVAVSGGADSVSLLQILARLADEYRLRLTAAHLNHGLRGAESQREEAFVRRLSAEKGIACICKTVDIGSLQRGKGRSLEEIGREERYRFLDEAAERCGAGKIATGHHRDDQAETVLMHLLRGSGPEGLRGILPIRAGRLIRPLLDVGRAEILEFLRLEGVPYMTDSSNLSPVFLRNRIRAELIPALTANYNPRLVAALCHTAGIIRGEDDYLQGVVRRIIEGWAIAPNAAEAVVPVAAFCGLHEALQGRIIKRLLETAVPSKSGIGYRHIEAVLALFRKSDGRCRSLDLPFGIRVEREGGLLRIQKEGERRASGRERKSSQPRFEYGVEIPATIHLTEIDRTIHLELIGKPTLREMKEEPRKAFMDYERMHPPLILRSAAPGERIDLFGLGGKKRLKEYFIDRKIPRPLRMKIPLLADSQSVVWIAGERISERVRVTKQTKRVLKAEMV